MRGCLDAPTRIWHIMRDIPLNVNGCDEDLKIKNTSCENTILELESRQFSDLGQKKMRGRLQAPTRIDSIMRDIPLNVNGFADEEFNHKLEDCENTCDRLVSTSVSDLGQKKMRIPSKVRAHFLTTTLGVTYV